MHTSQDRNLKLNSISCKIIPKLAMQTQENNSFHKSNIVYQNSYMANSIKFIFNKTTKNDSQAHHKRSNTYENLPTKKHKIQIDTLSNILSTTGILNHTKKSNFSNKRSVSTFHHQELVKDITLKNMNNIINNGNELRTKLQLDQRQIDSLVQSKKRFFMKLAPARHSNTHSLNSFMKAIEKCKQKIDQKGFEIIRKQENNEESLHAENENTFSLNKIFALTHTHINKCWSENQEVLPKISKPNNKFTKKREMINAKIKLIHRTPNINNDDEQNKIIYGNNKVKLPNLKDLLSNLNEDNFPQYNKELGPMSKFVNLENLNKPKKQKTQIHEHIMKRKSNVGPLDPAMFKNQSIIMNEKISLVLQKSEENKILENDSDSNNSIESELEGVKKLKKISKTQKGRDLRHALKKALQYLGSLKLNLLELQSHKIFSNKPYEKKNSFELIKACKHNDRYKAQELLFGNKYLVYDFDYVYLTALHWAAKRGYFEIAKLLLKFGADINSKDLIGRTPLYLSIKHDKIEVTQLLLFHQADPWSTTHIDYKAISIDNTMAARSLTRARQLYILMKMTPPKFRKAIWMKDSWTLLMSSDGKNDALLRRIME